MNEFNGRVAIVTGASSGIGRTSALFYAREGAKVVVSDLNKDGGQKTVQMIQAAGGGAIVNMASILGKPEEVAELVVWLSSNRASYITGSYYSIDGGYLAR